MEKAIRLGTLRRKNPRTVWPDEAADFTPWLAEESNVLLLGEAIGLELEVESTEVAVGPYSADILARETGTGKYVVIENQLVKTDHDHLGKAITYGSVLDATAVVWIAAQFTEEHKKALDWLNEYTTEELSFFGVQLEILQIDNSLPAVQFNVISRPVGIQREAAARRAEGPVSDIKQIQLEFWTRFREKLLENKVVTSAQTPRPKYWFDVRLGRTNFKLSNICDTWGKKVGVRVYLRKKVADAALEQLFLQRDSIEREIGFQLNWNPHPENQDKIIIVTRNADIHEKDSWDEHLDWLVEMNRQLIKAFKPRIKALKLD